MKNFFSLTMKGALVGGAIIVPGLSGGTMGVILKIYDRLIGIISDIFPNLKNKNKEKLKEDIFFIIPLLLGVLIGIILLAKLLEFLLEFHKIPTYFAFIGLIVGTLPMLFKEAHKNGKPNLKIHLPIFIIAFLVVIGTTIIGNSSLISKDKIYEPSFLNALIMIVFGFISGATMILPGISGSSILIILGGYETVLSATANIFDFSILFENLAILIPLAIGALLGIYFISVLIKKLLQKHYTATYYAILGLVVSSIYSLFPGFNLDFEGVLAIIILIAFAVGSYFLAKVKEPEVK